MIWKGKSMPLFIKESGNLVSGYSKTGARRGGEYRLEDGVVSSKTLYFRLLLRSLERGNGQFVLDEGGKSFKGKINGDPVTGIYIRP
jgi:hypothetical protein